MCETLFLKNTCTNKVLAFLKDVDMQSRLQNLRVRINSEISLLSNGIFEFVIAGTAINKKQEQKYKVGMCSVRSADGKWYLHLKCYTTTPIAAVDWLCATNADKEGTNSYFTNDKRAYSRSDATTRDSEIRTGENKHTETSQIAETKRNYPNFYSDKSINETTDDLEKERKVFFNSKLDEIITGGSLHDWGIQAIHGVIDVHWVLRKNDILKNSAKELIARITDSKSEASSQEEQNSCNNLDELEKAKSLVDSEYARVSADLEREHKNRNELEKSFDETFTKLKVAQSNLKKTIDHYKDFRSKHCQKSYLMKLCWRVVLAPNSIRIRSIEFDQDVELTENEMDFLASTVKDDYFEN